MSFSKGSFRTYWTLVSNGGGIWQKTRGKAREIFEQSDQKHHIVLELRWGKLFLQFRLYFDR